jgi:hypothetical protein
VYRCGKSVEMLLTECLHGKNIEKIDKKVKKSIDKSKEI